MRNRLRTRLNLLVALFASVAMLAGCGRADTGAADLEAGLTLFEQANQGYLSQAAVDRENPPSETEYREATFQEAREKFEAVLQSGTDAQQVTARRFLAKIHANAARVSAEQAASAQRALRTRSSELLDDLSYINALISRAASLRRDRSEIRQQLQAELERQQGERGELASEVQRYESQLDDLANQRDAHRAEMREASQQEQELRKQAFTAEGEQQYELLEEARGFAATARQAETAADKVQVQIDRLESQKQLAESSLAELDKAIAGIEQQLTDFQSREQARARQLANVQERRISLSETLVSDFQSVYSDYQQNIAQPYSTTHDRMRQAVSQLEQAVQTAQGQKRETLRQSLLAMQSERVAMLIGHTKLADSLAETAGSLATRAPGTLADSVDDSAFRDQAQAMQQRRQELRSEARTAAQAAQTVADELADSSDEQTQQFAQQQQTVLTRYLSQLGTTGSN